MVIHKLYQNLHQKLLRTLPQLIQKRTQFNHCLRGLDFSQVSSDEEEIAQLEKENTVLFECQFSLGKIKDDNAAILFYTAFSTHESLMSFYHYVEPKQKNAILKENQPGPSRKLPHLDEFLLV